MIVGYGLDLVEVARIARLLDGELGERFVRRVFTENERRYCDAHRAARAVHYAGRFAAKEALVKALGAPEGLTWQDMDVSSEGPPRFDTRGVCLQALTARCVARIHLSVSHDGGLAIAGVVLEST